MLFAFVEHPKYFVGDLKHFFYVWFSVSQLSNRAVCVLHIKLWTQNVLVAKLHAHYAILYRLSIMDYTFKKMKKGITLFHFFSKLAKIILGICLL